MAKGLFRHISVTELQQMLANWTTRNIDGKNRVVSSASSEGVSVTKEWDLTPEVYLEEVNYALELKAPASYTPRVRRTSIRYV